MVAGPGLAKTRKFSQPVAALRHFIRANDPMARDLLDHADIRSEGATDAAGTRYFGTTSIALCIDDDAAADALARDPHLRTRSLRIARREAELRAGGQLGTAQADVSIHRAGVRLMISIEIEGAVRIVSALAP